MLCPKCHHELANDVSFCPVCGKRISKSESKFNPVTIGIAIACAVILIILICCFAKCCVDNQSKISGPQLTVQQYKRRLISEISNDISNWAHSRPDLVLYVENRHGTVTVDDVDLMSVQVRTVDGGNILYEQGENISSIEVVLRFWWDGLLHKDGHTDLRFITDRNLNARSCELVETDAFVDLEDPEFWFGAAALLLL